MLPFMKKSIVIAKFVNEFIKNVVKSDMNYLHLVVFIIFVVYLILTLCFLDYFFIYSHNVFFEKIEI